jgi:hypothetical protein
MKWTRAQAMGAVLIGFPLLVASAHCQVCPLQGTAKGAPIQERNRLKNRTAIPTAADFDSTFTLAAALKPGNDNNPPRWSEAKAARIIVWVHRAKPGGVETVNCGSKTNLDTHIENVLSLSDSMPNRRFIAEITPRMRKWAKANGKDWSTATLSKTLTGHKVEIEGWIFNDSEHAPNAENTHPGNKLNWRATTYELHPITSIRIIQ